VVPVGNLAGANEKFNGLVLFFDSKDDDGKGDNPIVNGWMNDGTKLFNHDTDGLGTRFGGCRAKYRNRPEKFLVRVRFEHGSLRVELNMKNNDVFTRPMQPFQPANTHVT